MASRDLLEFHWGAEGALPSEWNVRRAPEALRQGLALTEKTPARPMGMRPGPQDAGIQLNSPIPPKASLQLRKQEREEKKNGKRMIKALQGHFQAHANGEQPCPPPQGSALQPRWLPGITGLWWGVAAQPGAPFPAIWLTPGPCVPETLRKRRPMSTART